MSVYVFIAALAQYAGLLVAAQAARAKGRAVVLPAWWGVLAMLLAWVGPAVSELVGGRREFSFQFGWAAFAIAVGFALGLATPWLAERAERLWRRLNPSGFHVALFLVAAASLVVLVVGAGPLLLR